MCDPHLVASGALKERRGMSAYMVLLRKETMKEQKEEPLLPGRLAVHLVEDAAIRGTATCSDAITAQSTKDGYR